MRLLFLNSHYRSEQNFTFASLEASQNAWQKLLQIYFALKKSPRDFSDEQDDENEISQKFTNDFLTAVENDLNTSEALAVLWQMLKNTSLTNSQKYRLLLDFDRILGLGLIATKESNLLLKPNQELQVSDLPEKLQKLFAEREEARLDKDYAKADQIRLEFAKAGYQLVDLNGSVIIKTQPQN